jgi:hypothetical protein
MKILEVGSRGSSCELTSPSRARYAGPDQPFATQKAVTELRHDAKGSKLKETQQVSLVKVSLSKKRFRR